MFLRSIPTKQQTTLYSMANCWSTTQRGPAPISVLHRTSLGRYSVERPSSAWAVSVVNHIHYVLQTSMFLGVISCSMYVTHLLSLFPISHNHRYNKHPTPSLWILYLLNVDQRLYSLRKCMCVSWYRCTLLCIHPAIKVTRRQNL